MIVDQNSNPGTGTSTQDVNYTLHSTGLDIDLHVEAVLNYCNLYLVGASSCTHPGQRDLRALSSAIMAATERAELVAHETDRWLTGHQEFDDLDLVPALISEAEVCVINRAC